VNRSLFGRPRFYAVGLERVNIGCRMVRRSTATRDGTRRRSPWRVQDDLDSGAREARGQVVEERRLRRGTMMTIRN